MINFRHPEYLDSDGSKSFGLHTVTFHIGLAFVDLVAI